MFSVNEANKNAQSIAADMTISTEKTSPEQVLSKLSPVFMKSIEEKNSTTALSKGESKLKSMLKPRYLIPLAVVVTGTALTILAYKEGLLTKEKIGVFVEECQKEGFSCITKHVPSYQGSKEQIGKAVKYIAHNFANPAIQQVSKAREFIVQTAVDNVPSFVNTTSIGLKDTMEQVGKAREFIVQKTLDNADSLANTASVGLKETMKQVDKAREFIVKTALDNAESFAEFLKKWK